MNSVANTSPVNFPHRPPNTHLSARKLAARLWHLRVFQIQSSPPRVKLSKKEVTIRSKIIGDSVVSALISELLRAQSFINKLKAQHKSYKKKIEEEKLLWKRRQVHKTEAMLEELKDKLARERRSRERMESLSTKLANELAQAKLCANQYMINYEEEKKKRQLLEQICNQLTMQMGEDRAKLEGLQRHSVKMEEERNMFLMAELWREESIQMKLVDAKLALEDKYNQMIQLISHLQSFLRSRGDELDTMELRDAQLIKQAAESVNIHCVTELSYDFTKSSDVFSIYEELRKGNINERVIQVEPDYPPNVIGPSSTIHIVSIDEDCFKNNSLLRLHQSSNSGDYSTALQVINVNQDKNIWESESDLCFENQNDGCCIHCVSVAQEDPTFDKGEGSGESGLRQCELLGQRNFADSENPHITRGMKGRIEWPRGIAKIDSKVIPLEERVRKQKSQLQHILKPLA
ncbi:uncharacterized protein LOC113874646 [Abrus precatorius]|uniref:Uncharacterized protein LOC113874646 n=1 Tax=Abrus precatorius TaxID=3816 RepID=A0A8B8MM26_ABRPR|nr:uncharacterized protein LOC113874646 [Abrus precatorius]